MSDEPYLGEIAITAFNFAPRGWALCNGQLLPINQNQALFSLLGTTYGGNGQTTFALPDLRGRVPVHAGSGHVLGERGGAEAHTLTTAELPAHVHSIQGAAARTSSRPTGASPAPGGYYGTPGAGGMAPTQATGGSQPHYNMQPYLGLNFIIALTGIFPSPN